MSCSSGPQSLSWRCFDSYYSTVLLIHSILWRLCWYWSSWLSLWLDKAFIHHSSIADMSFRLLPCPRLTTLSQEGYKVHLRDWYRFRAYQLGLCAIICFQCNRISCDRPLFGMGYCPGSQRKGSLFPDPSRMATYLGRYSWLFDQKFILLRSLHLLDCW